MGEMRDKIVEKFQIPEPAVPFLDVFFTEEDLLVIDGVEKDAFTAADVTPLLTREASDYLEEAYRRGIVSWKDRSSGLYQLNNFYGFLDVFVVTQKERYHEKISREDRGRIDAWYFSTYCSRLDPDYSHRPTEDVILTLEESLEYIDRDDRQLYWTNCDCKCLLGDCGLPTKVCLSYAQGDNAYSDRQVSEPVTKEQAKQILRDADRAGLMHTWNPGGFCNCCGDCCYLFRAQKVRGSIRLWPRQNYLISYDREKCVGCGLCTRRCHFQVLTKNEEKKITLDTSRCVGCGICANACPAEALKLVRLEETKNEL
jgi:Pyruvate/2-oxoacid:ferredoxin oxidoreductase delta subunit